MTEDFLRTLTVLVPRPGTPAGLRIATGSGIVTADATGDRVLVYYEGNLYDADNMRTFQARVEQAAGRLIARYPTVACGQFDRADFDIVGTYEGRGRQLRISDPATLMPWAQS